MNSSSHFNSIDPRRQLAESFLLIVLCLVALSMLAGAQTRIKDVATVEGARDNQLIGYGIVAGLDGHGDSDKLFTQQTVSNLARRFGIQILPTDITNKNVAIVMVTATIPAFTRQGTKLNATVASLADASSLQGGVLMQTPLVAGDGQVYAVAQGSVFLGGFDAGTSGAGGSSVQKNHTTSGVVTNGALVENEIPTTVFSKGILEIVLHQGDFTSAVRMANAINEQVAKIAQAVSPTTVEVFVPKEMQSPERQMEFVARIENASFVPDVNARIVINERTGTVVANANIQISKVAVAYGNLTVAVTSAPEVSQPNPYTGNSFTDNSFVGNGGTNGSGHGRNSGGRNGGRNGGGRNAPGGGSDSGGTNSPGGGNDNGGTNGTGDGSDTGSTNSPSGGSNSGGAIDLADGHNGGGRNGGANGFGGGRNGGGSNGFGGGRNAGGANGSGGGSISGAQTVVVDRTTTNVQEEKRSMVVLNMPTVEDVAFALNSMGATPRELMSILQSIKDAGALNAELVLE
jgi:flagellar P-ring protein precursor FlgI